MSYPLVRDLAAEGIPVRLTCGVLGHSTQAYYAWLARPISDREMEDAYLTNALIDAHEDDPEFGYRFLTDELERAGHAVGERRVWRLCSQQKLWSTTVRKGRRGAGKSPGPAVHDDHVQRNFTAEEPDQAWAQMPEPLLSPPIERHGLPLDALGLSPALRPHPCGRDERATHLLRLRDRERCLGIGERVVDTQRVDLAVGRQPDAVAITVQTDPTRQRRCSRHRCTQPRDSRGPQCQLCGSSTATNCHKVPPPADFCPSGRPPVSRIISTKNPGPTLGTGVSLRRR